MRPDGVNRLSHNDRCPRRPLVQLFAGTVAVIYLAVMLFPQVRPYMIVAGVLLVTAIMALVITRVTRRRRARAGACMTCEHPCIQQLPDDLPVENSTGRSTSQPVPVQITQPSERDWLTRTDGTWEALKRYESERMRAR
jgi:hypothetical protein